MAPASRLAGRSHFGLKPKLTVSWRRRRENTPFQQKTTPRCTRKLYSPVAGFPPGLPLTCRQAGRVRAIAAAPKAPPPLEHTPSALSLHGCGVNEVLPIVCPTGSHSLDPAPVWSDGVWHTVWLREASLRETRIRGRGICSCTLKMASQGVAEEPKEEGLSPAASPPAAPQDPGARDAPTYGNFRPVTVSARDEDSSSVSSSILGTGSPEGESREKAEASDDEDEVGYGPLAGAGCGRLSCCVWADSCCPGPITVA